MTAVAGNVPERTIIVPANDTPGQWLLMRIIYPMIATPEQPIMYGALRFVFSDNTATVIAVMNATP